MIIIVINKMCNNFLSLNFHLIVNFIKIPIEYIFLYYMNIYKYFIYGNM